MDFLNNLLKFEWAEGARTYLAIGGVWLASISEWAGFDVPGFVAMQPVETFFFTLAALGIYEKAKESAKP